MNMVGRVPKVSWNLWIALMLGVHSVLQIMDEGDELHVFALCLVGFIHDDLTETNGKEPLKYHAIWPFSLLGVEALVDLELD